MKKTKRFTAILLAAVLLGGCGSQGVSQEEYDKISQELNNANGKISELESQIETIQGEFDSYKEQMEEYEELSEKEAEARKVEANRILQAQKEEEERKAKEEQEKKEAEEKLGYETGITYEQLARTPDDYKWKKVKFYGKVIQVIEGDSEIQIRFAVDSNYDTIIYGEYSKNIVSERILENDIVTIYGESVGTITYKSTLGGNITIPGVLIEKIDTKEGIANNEQEKQTFENLIYEDSNIKIYYNGISGKEDDYKINFTIENLSNKTLQVSDKDTSINGYMADPLFVVTIAPGKKAKDGMSMSYSRAEDFPMSGIKSIETKFHVSNEDDWKDYYDTENVIVLSEE